MAAETQIAHSERKAQNANKEAEKVERDSEKQTETVDKLKKDLELTTEMANKAAGQDRPCLARPSARLTIDC